MATVTYAGASRVFDAGRPPAVERLDLDIADGEFLVLVGPSGCGKSTSLRMLAGLEPVNDGTIYIDGHDMAGVRPRDRDVAMVFQTYALYPNMTVRDNMGFALTNAGMKRAEIARRVDEAAEILQLQEFLDRKPAKLSGGQRQRVAMGRAIVREPKVFCMDEPLSNLDAKLRVSTRGQIAGLQKRLGVTTLYVTHDQVEAMTMGDRVAVLLDGKLQQVAAPEELYDHPDNTFVAGFIGSPAITLLDAPVRGGIADVAGLQVPVPRGVADSTSGRLTVGARPESWELLPDGTPGAMRVRVDLVEALGSESFVYATPVGSAAQAVHDSVAGGTTSEQTVAKVSVKSDRAHRPTVGEVVSVRPRDGELYFFDADSGKSLHRREIRSDPAVRRSTGENLEGK